MKMIKIPLSKYCTVIVGKDKPTDFSEEKNEKYQIPIYANGIENDGIVGYTNKALIQQEAVTVSARGNVGTAFYRSEPFVPIIRLLVILTDKQYIDTKYLYYVLKNMSILGVGSIQKQLTRPDMEKKIISIFEDVEYQKRIANILSRIDDKINNNNKIIAELEAMAKTIYDYWFLQYEFPNEEGKPYKSSGGKIVYNEKLKKEIPEGWTVEKLEDMLEILKDGTHNPPKRIDQGIPLLTGTMFGKNFLNYKEATYISKDDYEKIHTTYAPKENDLIITKIGTLGNVNYITKEDIPLAIHCNSALLRFKKQYKNVFPFLLLKSDEFQVRMKALRGKSIQEFISLNKLGSIVCLTPDTHIIERFENYLIGIFEKMKAIRKENEELTKLRDELLPLLMNGQVGFKE